MIIRESVHVLLLAADLAMMERLGFCRVLSIERNFHVREHISRVCTTCHRPCMSIYEGRRCIMTKMNTSPIRLAPADDSQLFQRHEQAAHGMSDQMGNCYGTVWEAFIFLKRCYRCEEEEDRRAGVRFFEKSLTTTLLMSTLSNFSTSLSLSLPFLIIINLIMNSTHPQFHTFIISSSNNVE